MCGICGIFNIDGRPVQRDLVEAMNSTMVHRRPDGDGVFVKERFSPSSCCPPSWDFRWSG